MKKINRYKITWYSWSSIKTNPLMGTHGPLRELLAQGGTDFYPRTLHGLFLPASYLCLAHRAYPVPSYFLGLLGSSYIPRFQKEEVLVQMELE